MAMQRQRGSIRRHVEGEGEVWVREVSGVCVRTADFWQLPGHPPPREASAPLSAPSEARQDQEGFPHPTPILASGDSQLC